MAKQISKKQEAAIAQEAADILSAASAEYQALIGREAASLEYQADMAREAAALEAAAALAREKAAAAALKILPQEKSGRGRMGRRYEAFGKSPNNFLLSAGSGQIDKAYMAYHKARGRYPSFEEAAALLEDIGLSEKDIKIHVVYYQRHKGLYLD